MDLHLLYLHGFRSTPHSTKASLMAGAVAAARMATGAAIEWHCPQLPARPQEAVAIGLAQVEGVAPERIVVIGSSLGGFYATWIAERLGCRAVLLNPAIRPYDDLAAHLGRQPVYGSEHDAIDMRAEYLDELRALDVPRPSRLDRYLLVAATGDELIDWREMSAKYAGCRQLVRQGSDHALSDFPAVLPAVLAFCGVPGGAGGDDPGA